MKRHAPRSPHGTFGLIAALLAALLGTAVPALAGIAELQASIAGARLSSTEVPPSRRDFRVGHLELDLANGSLLAVAAGDTVVGLFFRGQGRFRYVSEDRYEKASWAVNVKRATGYAVEGNAVGGSFETALILDSRLAGAFPSAGAFEGEPPEGAAEALAKLQSRFARDRGVVPANLVAQALTEGASRPVVCVQLDAGRKDLLYLWDGLRTGIESLAVMELFPRGTDLAGARWAQELSSQPLSGDRLAPRPVPFVVRHVDLEVRNPADRRLELEVRETVEAGLEVRTLAFALWSERFEKGAAIPYRLESVTLADGTALSFVHDRGDLVVELPRPLPAGARLELRFRMAGDILYRPGGDSFWWLPIGHWLPLPERLDMMGFTYRARVRAAPPFLPFSMGRTVRRWEEEGLACAEFALDKPVQFAVVLAGKYHTYEETRDGLTLRLASYAFSQDEPMRKIAHNVFELVRFYEPLLGELPFEELNILHIHSYGFGIAPPGVIYLTSEAFDPSPAGRAFRAELNMRMAHEVAHMWWGHVAQMASFDDQWLSESTAEYYAAVAVGRLLGQHKFKAAYRQWQEQAGRVRAPESVFLANRLAGEKAFLDRYGLLYAKGPLMLHALREELGDQLFFTVMKSLLTNFRSKHVATGEFLRLTDFVTKRDNAAWFAEHLFALR